MVSIMAATEVLKWRLRNRLRSNIGSLRRRWRRVNTTARPRPSSIDRNGAACTPLRARSLSP